MKNHILLLAWVCSFLSLQISLQAQKAPIFDFVDISKAEVNQHVRDFAFALGQPDASKAVKQSWVVRFRNFSRKENLQMPIDIPGINADLVLKSDVYFEQKVNIEKTEINYEIWSGVVEGPRQSGDFMISRSDDGLISGDINFNGKHFKVRPIDYVDALLVEQDASSLKSARCGLESSTEPTEFIENNATSSTLPFCDPPPAQVDCRNPWTLLHAYTDSLYDQIYAVYDAIYGGIPIYSHLPEQLTLYELTRGGRQFGVTLAGSGLYYNLTNYYVEVATADVTTPQNGNTNLVWMSNDREEFENYAEDFLGLKDTIDKALLQTHRTYGGTYGIADGIPVSSNGYNTNVGHSALVNYEGMDFPWYAYPHEMGHLFGGEHSNESTDLCNRGYIYRSYNGPDRTLMAILSDEDADDGKGSILRFSSPELTYDGFTIGTYADHNVARVVQNVICGNVTPSPAPEAIQLFENNISKPQDLVIFPNPTNGSIIIEGIGRSSMIQLIDLNGRILSSIIPKADKITFNLSPFDNGVYLIRNITENSSSSYKVIKNE